MLVDLVLAAQPGFALLIDEPGNPCCGGNLCQAHAKPLVQTPPTLLLDHLPEAVNHALVWLRAQSIHLQHILYIRAAKYTTCILPFCITLFLELALRHSLNPSPPHPSSLSFLASNILACTASLMSRIT